MSKIDIRAGDVILSSGSQDSQVRIQKFINSQWNGVSIVIPWTNSNRLVLLESTQIPICEDIVSGTMISGVQIVDLQQKLDRYPGKLVHRSLVPALDLDRLSLLAQFVKSTWGIPFNDSPYDAARAFYRRNSQVSINTFFCAELVATAYQQLGILMSPPHGRNANNYIPGDFSEEQELLDLDRRYLFASQHSIDSFI
jgi:hypothetical protein